MSKHGRKRVPLNDRDGVWQDLRLDIGESSDDGFSDNVDRKLDLQKEILRLPTMQRIAVLKRLRGERLTGAENDALYRAKESLKKWLD